MTYLKSKNNFLVFHSDFWCLEGGGQTPPHHLTYIFNPVPNRVNLKILFYVLILQTLLINPISVLFKKKQDKTKDETTKK